MPYQNYTPLLVLIFITGLLAFFFREYPLLDLEISIKLFHFQDQQGTWYRTLLYGVRRANFLFLYLSLFALCCAAVGAIFFFKKHRRPFLRKILFVACSFLFSCAVVSDFLIKDTFKRSRPGKVLIQAEAYTPPFSVGNCSKNCSFISGEVAFATAFFAFLIFVPRRRKGLVSLGMSVWVCLVSWMRMAQIGHYFSDVLFAIVFTLIVLEILRHVFRMDLPFFFHEASRD